MHRFCTRFIFITLMMVPNIVRSMLVENIGGNCCEHKKELGLLSNKGRIQKIQYVQLKKITKGKLGDKKDTFANSSPLQKAGANAVLILRGIQLKNCEILQNLKFEQNMLFHRNNLTNPNLPEILFPVKSWKNFHKLKVRVPDNKSNNSDNLFIYKDVLYIDMMNGSPHNDLYLSSESDYMSLIDQVRKLHKKANYSFAILARLNRHNDDISHENFLPVVVNKVDDVLEYVGTENIFDCIEGSCWKDFFDKLRQLVEEPKKLEKLIVSCVLSEARKELDEMGLGNIRKETNELHILQFKSQIDEVFKTIEEIESKLADANEKLNNGKQHLTKVEEDLSKYNSKLRSLRRVFCIGSIFGGAAVVVFGFILLRLCGFKYART